MTYINNITHQEKFIEPKVNFFADYFNYVASEIFKSDFLEIENYLSLIEKIIFQIENNPENCTKYIDSYLTHPLLQKDNYYFKDYKNYEFISNLFEHYKKNKTKELKVSFIDNLDFNKSLIIFRTELKRFMFKKSLKAIISFLKCNHNLNKHLNDIIHHTNILISEFIFFGYSKEDILKTFSKIITSDINSFPFPKSIKPNLNKQRELYIKNRTFDQQFNGIINILKEKKKNEYFIYRIYNIKTDNNFSFKYDQVTFYNAEHEKFKHIKLLNEKNLFNRNFFCEKKMILACIKVNYSSKKIAEQTAINIIKKELTFLNNKIQANCLLESNSYLTTSNFKDLGSKWSKKENSHYISDYDKYLLSDNPFNILKKINQKSKDHFLNFESLYIKSLSSKSPDDYWQYFETLFKKVDNKPDQIINLMVSILLKSYHKNEKELIEKYVINSLINSPFKEFYSTMVATNKNQSLRDEDFDKIEKVIDNPLIRLLLTKRKNLNKPFNEKFLKNYYSRIFWECYSQRNSLIHSYQVNEKSLISLDSCLHELTLRLRKTLIIRISKNENLKFEELTVKLKK